MIIETGLTKGIFWLGMLLALTAGFLAVFPVDIILVKRSVLYHN